MIIGILTFHLPTNFGANLQAFASSRYFSSLGHIVYVYNFARPEDLNNIRNTSDVQKAAHQSFVDSNLPLTRMITTAGELKEVTRELGIELIVVGADAVWRQPKDENIYFAQWALNDPELAHVKVVSMSPAHMGDGFKNSSQEQRSAISDCLKKFSFISVRDDWTRYVINRDLFDDEPFVSHINPDPVFTLSLDENDIWDGMGQQSDGYVVMTLPPKWNSSRSTRLKRTLWFYQLRRRVHQKGLKLVELPVPEGVSGMPFDFTIPYPINPVQWFLWLKNARYFIGLRFHAIVSCCASGTPFFSYDSYSGKGQHEKSKIYNLLKGSQFEGYRTDQLTIVSPRKLIKQLEGVKKEDVLGFRDCNKQLFDLNMKQMIAIVDGRVRKIEGIGSDCTSCFACFNICPKQAITMPEDAEGFYTPKVDYDKCIGCGLCDNTCPQLNNHQLFTAQKSWYGYQVNESERKASSSGGLFGALATPILQEKGVVYGAAFNYGETFLRLACYSTDEIELDALKKSKYVQSYVGDAFIRVKRDLEHGRKVLFCGTPCQVDGLRQVLKKYYQNLLTVDFVCHGVPPMSLLRDHLHMLGFEKVTSIDFRPKHHSWMDNFDIKNGASRRSYSNYWGNDAYYYSFEKAYNTHRSCGNCRYCNGLRASDITLADFWGYKGYDKTIYDPKGISLIIANTPKGIGAVEAIGRECVLNEIDLKFSEYVYSRKRGGEIEGYYDMKRRNSFFGKLKVYGYQEVVGQMGLQKKPQKLVEKAKVKLKSLLPVK